MRVIQVNDYAEMSQKAAEMISEQVRKKPDSVLGLATGETMLGTYAALVNEHQQHNTSYRDVRTFNLDEYIGLDATHPNSYRYYMNERLFRFLDIPLAQTYIPNGCAPLLEEECARYERLIEQCGGIDLQLLGIGQNGHIGFNEPNTSFASTTHVVQLSESTRKANARFFPSADAVPTHAITMGIATIMKSKQIILLVSGKRKAWAVSHLLEGEITPAVPASILKAHPNVIVIADTEALSHVSQEKRKVHRP